ncbi:hypothetical protein MXD81_13270, partial [Microbacteriaceae bacterium K1510]|nr:hypothetical protein [Microbacteriaceae bacterium K1510]
MANRKLTVAAIQTWYGHDLRDNIARTEAFVRQAAKDGAQIVLPSELFQGIYFCTRQDPKWFTTAHPVSEHPCVLALQKLAAELANSPALSEVNLETLSTGLRTRVDVDRDVAGR